MTDISEPVTPGLYAAMNGDMYIRDCTDSYPWMSIQRAVSDTIGCERLWFKWSELLDTLKQDELPVTRIGPELIRVIQQGLTRSDMLIGINGADGDRTMLGPCTLTDVSGGVLDVTIRGPLDNALATMLSNIRALASFESSRSWTRIPPDKAEENDMALFLDERNGLHRSFPLSRMDGGLGLDASYDHILVINDDGTVASGILDPIVYTARPVRAVEPSGMGMYRTRSGRTLFRIDSALDERWVTADFDVACGRRMVDWDTVVGSLDDSEFPLKRIDEKGRDHEIQC